MNIDKLKKLFDASMDKYGDAKKIGTTLKVWGKREEQLRGRN